MTNRRDVLAALALTPLAMAAGAPSAAQRRDVLPARLDDDPDWSRAPDEIGEPDGYASFSKGLVHSEDGLPQPDLYRSFSEAIRGRNLNELERLRPAAGVPWVDPTAGTRLNPPETLGSHREPWFRSRTMIGEVAELCWAALCRDAPFASFPESTLVSQAEHELGRIDPDRYWHPLFQSGLPRTHVGPYVSQFLLQRIPFGPTSVEQIFPCPEETSDFLTSAEAWQHCQDGGRSTASITYLSEPRYIFNGRMLADYVRTDFSYQPYLLAALLIQSWGRAALNPGLPHRYTRHVSAFVRNGWPDIFALLAEASILALQDCWFWKWRVFRRLRPEELSARIGLAMSGQRDEALRDLASPLIGLQQCEAKFGTSRLPQTYPDGCPLHPSFPSGHAAIAGACVTVLKAFSNPEFVIPAKVTPSLDGRSLSPLEEPLTLEGELNKLAWNASFGRSFAGIHYRSDCDAGLLLGERIGMDVIAAARRGSPGRGSAVWFPQFDGNWVSIEV